MKRNGGDPDKDKLNDQLDLLDRAMKSGFFYIKKIKKNKIFFFFKIVAANSYSS